MPSIVKFTVDRAEIGQGEEATLSFEAKDAEKAVITDQRGQSFDVVGDASKGTLTVKPTETSFYVLTVSGEGGSDTAFVQVAVGQDLKTSALVAVPPEVDSGQPAQLLWTAFNAKAAQIQTSTGEIIELENVAAGTGIVEVKPERTVTYHLIASGVDPEQQQDNAADVRVRPVVASFKAEPAAAKPGQTITLSWSTRGAAEVSLSEQSFGQLHTAAHPAETQAVDQGSFTFTVPQTLPNGNAVLDGHPLRFTLTVKQSNPEITLTRFVDGHVGEGPLVTDFRAPAAVTRGKTFELRWRTQNAVKLQVVADGGVLYEPFTTNVGEIKAGSITVAAPEQDTTYEIRVWSHLGVFSSAKRVVRAVDAPSADTFTLPVSVASPGDAANAEWTTSNATRVVIRVKDGPSVFHTATKAAAGNAPVYPGLRTTFVLEAYNDANDVDTLEATVDLGNPGGFTATPAPVTRGDTVTVSWMLDENTIAQVVGEPLSPPLATNATGLFIDLESHVDAQELGFTDPDDGTDSLALSSPFHFPFVGTMNDRFYVSTNGFLTFGPSGALPDNAPLDEQSATPAMIAPFWDDLNLGPNGKVLYLVDGDEFPRRLVVQWNKVRTADPDSELTFQVQLFENGEFRFAYGKLTGGDSAGESANIGWRVNGSLARDLSVNGAIVAENDELEWFSSGTSAGQFQFVPVRSGQLSMFGRRATGGWVVFPARLNVIAPNAVLVNEVMLLPDASSTKGRWIELFNATGEQIDLSGTVLDSASALTSFTFPEGTTLDPQGFLVLGESLDPVENGEAAVTLLWGALNPDATNGDTLTLSASSAISSLAFTPAQLLGKESLQLPEQAIDSSGDPLTCARVETFGQVGDKGTPGKVNESCFPYRMTSIPLSYRDISGTGTPLFAFGDSNQDSVYAQVDLSAAPFTYFGTPHSSVGVSSNGLIAFPSLDSSWTGNKTLPEADDPFGSVAIFWDDLDVQHSPSLGNVFYQRIAAGQDAANPTAHWIIQWHDYTYWLSSPDDDLDFQIKLFDDGAIEYHYATMVSTDTENKASGVTATEWLENPDGSSALVIGINQSVNLHQKAFRFAPVK